MRWMRSIAARVAIVGFLWWQDGCAVAPLMHRGGIMVDGWAEVKADDKTVAGILAAFNRAEAAQVDDLMDLYSKSYSYHGLTKQDLKKIWDELLLHHREFRSNHILSRIVARPGDPQSVEVTCTGSLWAVSTESGEPVNIDSWYGEVHHMVNEDGTLRVRGHRGQPPKTLAFGAAPHPFF